MTTDAATEMDLPDLFDDPRDLHPNRWWLEILFIAAFYLIYSAIRNQFGSAAVSPETALDNAWTVIDLEESMGLFFEPGLQARFINNTRFIQFWNLFYGTFHFVVTGGALFWAYKRFNHRYRIWRNTLAFATALALAGFSLFPLMPPRLIEDCGTFGGCVQTEYDFVDTAVEIGGLWSFDSGTMQSISNQYAAMPSLHLGWAIWCTGVLYLYLRRWWARALMALYPVATLFAVVVTANHYWIDALGGALIVIVGYGLGRLAAERVAQWRLRNRPRVVFAQDSHAPPTPTPPHSA
ncbi:MAG: phosphatase PAP2 family protein [Actinomycetia bacterium]|nr:phosphatase PAP2 family protein [Actinomycetes bacterium]